MNETALLLIGLFYLAFAIETFLSYRKKGTSFFKALFFGIFWVVVFFVGWFKMVSAVLKNETTMKDFLKKITEEKPKEEEDDFVY